MSVKTFVSRVRNARIDQRTKDRRGQKRTRQMNSVWRQITYGILNFFFVELKLPTWYCAGGWTVWCSENRFRRIERVRIEITASVGIREENIYYFVTSINAFNNTDLMISRTLVLQKLAVFFFFPRAANFDLPVTIATTTGSLYYGDITTVILYFHEKSIVNSRCR